MAAWNGPGPVAALGRIGAVAVRPVGNASDGRSNGSPERVPYRNPEAKLSPGRIAARLVVLVLSSVVLFATALPASAGRGWIDDPTGDAALQVAFRDQLVTYQDIAEAQAALTRMAALVCDATEGQVRIARIRFTSSPAAEDLAAFWFHDREAASGGAYDAAGDDLRRLGAHMDVFASARLRPDRLAHLFGHHAFGLGDQYDDQRRRGGTCGIGPGFEPGRLDENNHSIMQASGGMRCAEGPLLGLECLRDDECAGAACRAVLASEWSTPANHDLLRGDGDVCPRPSPVTRIRLQGLLSSKADPLCAFDAKDFLAARATSVWQQKVEVLGTAGAPGIHLQLFLSHTSRLTWQLSLAADASEFGGSNGRLQLLRSWTLSFNPDFSLASANPPEMHFPLPDSRGRGPLELTLDVGTRNPQAQRKAGQGYDGLQMVAAGTTGVELSTDGVPGCTADWCAKSWNHETGRMELSEQSLLHDGASDWQTLTTNLPFLAQPRDGVVADPPPVCGTPPVFFTDVMGSDQVVFVLDTSRSMGSRVDGRSGEVCVNGTDDDGDGESDEADCADSRLEYERTAARAFLALVQDRKLQVGVVAMHTDAEILSGVADADAARRPVLGAVLGALTAEGDTAIGTALGRAQQALHDVEQLGRSRSVILLTDGANNVGIAPGQEADTLDPLLFRVHTVAIGRAADEWTTSAIAARRGGVAFATALASGTPAILAELAARHAGAAPLLPRTPFDLARAEAALRPAVASSIEFDIPVEAKAQEVVIFLSSRNDRIDDWRLLYELRGPDGERFDDTSPENRVERGFAILRVAEPRQGNWRLRVLPKGRGLQRSEILAFSSQPNADLFVDANPRLATVTRSVQLSARPSYVTGIEGEVALDGAVRRPDGSQVAITFTRDAITQNWEASFDQFAGRGFYEVRVRVRVGNDAQPALGEPIFPGPPRVLMRVAPFERTATTSFYVADGASPACAGPDCDGDGLADALETGCPQGEDADGDGMPNRLDADSDNDEIADGEEGGGDVDRNGIPDFCEPERTPDSLNAAIVAEEAAVAGACGADVAMSRDGVKASLSAVRRIVQVLRTRDGVPAEIRAEGVQKLEKVIELKKQAMVLADVLPEFCKKYQAYLEKALILERDLRTRVDPYLVK